MTINKTACALTAGVLVCSGCASSGYFTDRGRDAADIVTATLGTGTGAKARAGPIQPAIFKNSDLVGLRSGTLFLEGNGLVYNDELYLPYPVGRRKGKWPVSFGDEKFSLGLDTVAARRKKDVFAESLFPCVTIAMPASYYTQIEVGGGLGLTLRFGFNAGELLDFVLGWAGIDFFDDDIETRKRHRSP